MRRATPSTVTTCDSSAAQPRLQHAAFTPGRKRAGTRTGLPGELAGRLEPLIRQAGPLAGGYVYDATARKPLFRWRANRPRPLASNTKLFTAAAVLDRLRPLTAVHTKVLGTGTLRRRTWRGDLYLRGAGDPSFGAQAKPRRHQPPGAAASRSWRAEGARPGARRRLPVRLAHRRARLRVAHVDLRRAAVGALLRSRQGARRAAAYQANPVLATAKVFRAALEKHGIDVVGRGRHGAAPRARGASPWCPRGGSRSSCARVVKWSDSFGAEVLLKDFAVRVSGGRGSTNDRRAGGAALRAAPRGAGRTAGRVGPLPQEQGLAA